MRTIYTQFTPHGTVYFTATWRIRNRHGCRSCARVSQFGDVAWGVKPDGYNAGLDNPTLDAALRWLVEGLK